MKNNKERIPWQRFALSLIGIGIIVGKWQWGVWHLYSLPEHSISSFTSITTNDSYVIGAIVVFMITGKLIYDWKNNTASSIITKGENIIEKIKEERIETINQTITYNNTKEDDYTLEEPRESEKYEY